MCLDYVGFYCLHHLAWQWKMPTYLTYLWITVSHLRNGRSPIAIEEPQRPHPQHLGSPGSVKAGGVSQESDLRTARPPLEDQTKCQR